MKTLTEEEKLKYLLADIYPICGECKEFKKFSTYGDYYIASCTLGEKKVKYFAEACMKFKPQIFNFNNVHNKDK